MRPHHRVRRVAVWALHLAAFAAITLGLATSRTAATQLHAILGYLLVILSASATAGRGLGFTLAAIGALAIDLVFQVPFWHLGPDHVLDVLVVVVFLTVAAVTTQLLSAARTRAAEAELRTQEVSALAAERIGLLLEAERSRSEAATAAFRAQVLSGLSHDLRTPITTIRVLAQEAMRQGTAQGAAIEEQAARLQHLVQTLLDHARMRTHTFPIAASVNAAEDLIGALVRQLRGSLDGRRILTHVAPDGPPPLGWFDFAQTLRAVGNIAENALRFTPPGGAIEVGARNRADGTLELWVEDRGPGVPAAEAERIFEAFYRPPASSPDRARTGLGLAITRELVEAQRGRVYHHPRDGGGTRFVIELPAAPPEVPAVR